jgi:hypothetical protein
MIADNRPITTRKVNFSKTLLTIAILCCVLFYGCTSPASDKQSADSSLFTLLPASKTHIDFTNTLTEGLNTNVLMYEYFYNGGGVAIGDLNGDGLQDIYFTGNMTDNKLYLNQGHMQFKDITIQANVSGRPGPWKTGVSIVDVNGDGRLDIYVCYSGKISTEKRKNQLFINRGNDLFGIPVFAEEAEQFGLDIPSFTSQAYFFDYDRDGDLDMLLVNHNPQRITDFNDASAVKLMNQTDSNAGIRIFKNEHGRFSDVTKTSGIINSVLSYGLAAGIADLNNDGWPDIYISNDYNVPDRLYINNKNGTFTDELQNQLGHTSFYSMGNDLADFNNDLNTDIYTLDMLPEDNKRQKLLFGVDNYDAFTLNLRVGFYYQYMRNMLHLNNRDGTFSEIGQLAGISNTDWSWAPLFADYDNDGWKDLFVSNGYTKDYTNMDFLKYIGDNLHDRNVMRQDLLNIVRKMPSSDVKSYFFKNNADLTFSNVSSQWGITEPSNSNGAAYVDLDNDGDLDLVVNNINKPAFIYENETNHLNKNHYLEIILKGKPGNTEGIGAKLIIFANNKTQCLTQMPTRGFQSSVSPVLHFGLGQDTVVDSLTITWQTGFTQTLRNVKTDTTLSISENGVHEKLFLPVSQKPLFAEIKSPILNEQHANSFNDFKRQRLLLYPFSFSGPCMAKADVNGDGLEDVFVGGDNGKGGSLYIQQKNGQFLLQPVAALDSDKYSNDAAALFVDVNGDGKADLYVCSGGYNNFQLNDPLLQDRLYINDGRGNFTKSHGSLPRMLSSKSCVRAADINGDGYPDLFVGGKVIPGRYPEVPESYILINNGHGQFTDETAKWNDKLKYIGMVSDAVWVDINLDKKPDLVIVGEWMPVTILINRGTLVDETSSYFEKNYSGWWNCIRSGDFNHDGHPDLIAGNLGLNSQCRASDAEPAEMYYKDFDKNGTVDPVLCMYVQHKTYPFLTRDELLDQISMLRFRFPDYKSYADATLDKVFTSEELRGAVHLTANELSTVCFISDSSGKLHESRLPIQAQFSPVFTIDVFDYDKDGNEDLLLCGNVTQQRLRFGKYDANYGVLLKGNGQGEFSYIPQSQSGFHLKGDIRSVLLIDNILFFGINQKPVVAYKRLSEK